MRLSSASAAPSAPSDSAASPVARRALPRGTRLLWLGVLAALCGVLIVRTRNARTQAALAEHQISMHDAVDILDARMGSSRGAQRQALALKYARDESPALRYASIDTLAENPSAPALALIEQGFTDPASEVRKRAMEKLIDTRGGAEPGFRLLLAGLRDDDLWIREDAVTQINQRIGKPHSPIDKRAAPSLMAAIDDPSITVSAPAMRAMSKLTGHAWTVSSLAPPPAHQEMVAKWQAWWQGAQKDWPAPREFFQITPLMPTRSDPAPEFAVSDLDGRRFSNDDLKGKITLINFWGTWCGPCKAEVPELIRLHAAYAHGVNGVNGADSANSPRSAGSSGDTARKSSGANSPVAIIGLACSEKSADSVRDWCRDHQALYRQALAENEVRKAFGDIEEVPVSFLIDAQGRIRYRWDGDRDFRTFQAAIERLRHE